MRQGNEGTGQTDALERTSVEARRRAAGRAVVAGQEESSRM